MSDATTMTLMSDALDVPSSEVLDRLRHFSAAALRTALVDRGLKVDEVAEIVAHWDDFRRDDVFVALLAALVATVERQRGDVDAPISIWSDLEEGPSGRLLYFYLFALCAPDTAQFLRAAGCPEPVIERTLGDLGRHADIHRRKHGTTGVDAGWWMLVTLRGELVHVGSLQFHSVNLGVGTLSPSPWFGADEIARLGVGFRHGDPSVGVHIPEGARLGRDDLDATFDHARALLGSIWPTQQRRLATCQSWMLDDHLAMYLKPDSNIIGFQRRFTLLPAWVDDDGDTLEFIFRRPGIALGDLPRATTLQRAILEVLETGGHWRARSGWLDFDGLVPLPT